MEELQHHIATYINVLVDSLDNTNQADDRSKYLHHLAEAARWIGMLSGGSSFHDLRNRILLEKASFGRSYLSGIQGEKAENGYKQLLEFINSLTTRVKE